MADHADEAGKISEESMERAIATIQAAAARKNFIPEHLKGKCLNCLEPIQVGSYCDSDCRGDHQKRLTNQKL